MSGRRGQVFEHRWGLSTLRRRKPDSAKQVAYLNRVVKRANRAAGYDSAKRPHEWWWSQPLKSGGHGGVVVAFTRSEARSKIKKQLGLPSRKRLPTNIRIQKGKQVEREQE